MQPISINKIKIAQYKELLIEQRFLGLKNILFLAKTFDHDCNIYLRIYLN